MTITVYQLPQDQAKLNVEIKLPHPKHVWHDIPANRYVIYTDQDIPQVENTNE